MRGSKLCYNKKTNLDIDTLRDQIPNLNYSDITQSNS